MRGRAEVGQPKFAQSPTIVIGEPAVLVGLARLAAWSGLLAQIC